MQVCNLTYEQVAEALESRARDQQTITYNELAEVLSLRRVDNLFSKHPLQSFFEQLDAWDAIEGQPFRTAVVVHKSDGLPGMGFFKSIENHRATVIAPEAREQVWRKELEELFKYFDLAREQTVVPVRLTHAQQARLSRLAELNGTTVSRTIEANLTWLVRYAEEMVEMVGRGHDAVDAGQRYSSEEVAKMLWDRHGIDQKRNGESKGG